MTLAVYRSKKIKNGKWPKALNNFISWNKFVTSLFSIQTDIGRKERRRKPPV